MGARIRPADPPRIRNVVDRFWTKKDRATWQRDVKRFGNFKEAGK